MKILKKLFIVTFMFLVISPSTIVSAGDFDWIQNLNIQAQADLSGFKATLATRFKIGDVQVNAVLSNVQNPADAYMVLRLGEMSSKPTDYVIEQYKSGKNKGWGVLAQSLGIKPGSKEFKAMKLGHDLQSYNSKNNNAKGNSKEKTHGKK